MKKTKKILLLMILTIIIGILIYYIWIFANLFNFRVGETKMKKMQGDFGDVFYYSLEYIKQYDDPYSQAYLEIWTLYNQQKEKIVSTEPILDSWGSEKMLIPLIETDQMNSYLFCVEKLIIYEKSEKQYSIFDITDPVTKESYESILYAVENLDYDESSFINGYKEPLKKYEQENKIIRSSINTISVTPTNRIFTQEKILKYNQTKERMMSMTNTRIFEILGKQEQTEEEFLHRLYSVFQFSDANYTYTKTKQDIIRGLQDLSWISNTNLALVVWNATDYLQQESMNNILLSLEKEVVEYWKQKQEHHFSILLVESI